MCVVLGLAISACRTQPPRTSGDAAAGLETTKTEACSIVGIMACKATYLLSGDAAADRQSACFVLGSPSGERKETCGSIQGKAKAESVFVPVRLRWLDNSSNEAAFVIERCEQLELRGDGEKKSAACNGEWKTIGRVNADVTSYIDNSAVAKHTYLYRVKAVNDSGASGYTEEALITAPVK